QRRQIDERTPVSRLQQRMRIAFFADIHANREAFSACLDDTQRHGVDRFVFLGDYVGYGADPGWTLDQVREYVARGAAAVLGNHDAAVWSPDEWMNEAAQQAIDWTRAQLDVSQIEFLRKLPASIEDGPRLFVHAKAVAPLEWGYVVTAGDAEQSILASPCEQTYCGHLHVPTVYHRTRNGKVGALTPVNDSEIVLKPDRKWLAVLGAVGQPRDHDPAACYAILDTERPTLTYFRVAYDVESAARKIREAGLPLMLSIRLAHGY